MGRSWEIVVWLLVFAAAAAVVVGIVRSEAGRDGGPEGLGGCAGAWSDGGRYR